MQYQGQYTGAQIDAAVAKANNAIGQTINKTWSQLKAMRDGSTLVPGQWYRITDYTCTTTQANTQSAGHVFDIIVRADDVNVLNENAYATNHAGENYFDRSKLEAWELKYCLNNDTNRFAWADSTNGKGVVYWMRDNVRNNEFPYDVLNIRFCRYSVTGVDTNVSWASEYGCYDDNNAIFPSGTASASPALYYTISYSGRNNAYVNVDLTCDIKNVKIEPYYKVYKQYLNNIVLFRDYNSPSFKNITIESNCHNITIICNGDGLHIGKNCSNIISSNQLHQTDIGDKCSYILLKSLSNCKIGNNNNNIKTDDSLRLIIGNNCSDISLSSNEDIEIGNNCSNITAGTNFKTSIIGNNCTSLVIPSNCNYLNFKGYNEDIVIEKNYTQSIIFDVGSAYFKLTTSKTTSKNKLLCYLNFSVNFYGEGSDTSTVTHPTVNDDNTTTYRLKGDTDVNITF